MADLSNDMNESDDNQLIEIIELKPVESKDDDHDNIINEEEIQHRAINSRDFKVLEPVMTSSNEILSDDETPKVYLNLSSEKNNKRDLIKKQNIIDEPDEILSEHNIIIQEVNESDNHHQTFIIKEREERLTNNDICELARKQLESLSSSVRGRKKMNIGKRELPDLLKNKTPAKLKNKESEIYIQVVKDEKPIKLPCHILGRNKTNPELDPLSNGRSALPSRPGLKIPLAPLTSPVLSREEVEKKIKQKFKAKTNSSPINIVENRLLNKDEQIILTPIKKQNSIVTTINPRENNFILKQESGTEIPQEFIVNDLITPAKIEEPLNQLSTNNNTQQSEEDLIAILEGNDSDYDDIISKMSNKELERAIALQQIRNLPRRNRKRKNNPSENETNDGLKNNKTKIKIEEIIGKDWDDETEIYENNEQIQLQNKPPIILNKNVDQATIGNLINDTKSPNKPIILNKESNQNNFRSSRLIKKKIIWDPDAPETQISYASLVQNTNNKKQIQEPEINNTIKKINESTTTTTATTLINTNIKRSNTVSPSPRKKVKSEIDRLLGDEGAFNMLNDLKRESNNNNNNNNDLDDVHNKLRNTTVNNKNESSGQKQTKIKKETLTPSPSGSVKQNINKTIGKKKSARSSWDYVYQDSGNDDALIIRRRSNSSYSSCGSPRRLSLDVNQQTNTNDKDITKPSTSSSSSTTTTDLNKTKEKSPEIQIKKRAGGKDKSNFEFVKPNSKKKSKPIQSCELDQDEIIKIISNNNIPIAIEKYENYIKFNLTYDNVFDKKDPYNFLTKDRMNNIVKLLKLLDESKNCNMVLISSYYGNFCDGLDFSTITETCSTTLERNVNELQKSVFEFLMALLNFSKPLIASVQGDVVNFGLSILPIFDIVISDSTAVFKANYCKIGHIPEALALLTNSKRIRPTDINCMLLQHQVLTPASACEKGFVTHVNRSHGYSQYLNKQSEIISSCSQQCLKALKRTKQHMDYIKQIETYLIDEHKTLKEQWKSHECQESFKQFFYFKKW